MKTAPSCISLAGKSRGYRASRLHTKKAMSDERTGSTTTTQSVRGGSPRTIVLSTWPSELSPDTSAARFDGSQEKLMRGTQCAVLPRIVRSGDRELSTSTQTAHPV